MNADPLHDAKLKLDWAKRHIENLDACLAAYLGRNPYAGVIKRHHKAGHYVLRLREREALPPDIPLFIGDVIHNLRTSLDYLAISLVRLAGKSTKGVYFPFAATAKGLDAAISKKHIDRAGPKAVDVIRSLQPYKGGNAVLRGIHDLDIADKHTMIVPTTRFARLADVTQNENGTLSIKPLDLDIGPAENGDPLDVFTANGDVQIGQQHPITTEIVFDERAVPFGGGLLCPVLEDCHITVNNIIKTFDQMIRRGEIP